MMMTISVILTACGTPIILMITIIKAEANVQLFVWFFVIVSLGWLYKRDSTMCKAEYPCISYVRPNLLPFVSEHLLAFTSNVIEYVLFLFLI